MSIIFYQEKIFKVIVQKIILNIKEMELMFNEVNDNFENYKATIPYLSQPIIDNQFGILIEYRLEFEHILTLNFSEIDVSLVHSVIGGFSRVFDFSLASTEQWCQRSYNLREIIELEFKALIEILDARIITRK